MFWLGALIATDDITCCLPEIPLLNQKSVTHRQIPIWQVVNKIRNIRLTPKFFMSLSKVYENQGGANWFFVNNEVNVLFYIIRRNSPHNT